MLYIICASFNNLGQNHAFANPEQSTCLWPEESLLEVDLWRDLCHENAQFELTDLVLGDFPCACFHLRYFASVDQTTKERNMWTCQWSGKPVELCVHVQQSQLATIKVWNWNKSITVSCSIWAGALLTLCIAEQHQDGSRSGCLSDALICPLFSVIHLSMQTIKERLYY